MSQAHDEITRQVPLGGLGTGALEIGSDGRFRNLTINNNRTLDSRIPIAPHGFLAVRASRGATPYVRRLQTVQPGLDAAHVLPAGALAFRGQYPRVDFQVEEPEAPVAVRWSAFAPVVPYDYEASALPLVFFALQATNTGDAPLEVSAVLNWENTCGARAGHAPDPPAPIRRETVVSDADWERMKGGRDPGNERRLSADTGMVEKAARRAFYAGDAPLNALVFGDARAGDANEDGEYCAATPWSDEYETTLAAWDPETPESADRFWRDLAEEGGLTFDAGPGQPRCGALCNRFTLAAGETRSVEFVVSWYCPRDRVAGADAGNYYTNAYADARSVARAGLDNRRYFYAAVAAWQQRVAGAELPRKLTRRLISACEVLSTNSIHTREGDFGLFESLRAPRVNHLRGRWFSSMGLLLFYPRLELGILERMSERMLEAGSRTIRVSEGIEGIAGGEAVAPGAAQVESCAYLVAMTYRNYRFGGNLSALSRMAPRLQSLMAALLAQDKDIDGFPDIQNEAPGLAGGYASGFSAITAGLWLVALRVYGRVAEHQQFSDAAIYRKAFTRAARSFDRYFWNREHGYYTLYPNAARGLVPAHALSEVCHVGQLTPIWIAGFLGMPDILPARRVARVMEAIETHNRHGEVLHAISLPSGALPRDHLPSPDPLEDAAAESCQLISYLCATLQHAPGTSVHECYVRLSDRWPWKEDQRSPLVSFRHTSPLALWYLVAASPALALDLAGRHLTVRADLQPRGETRTHTLFTPNGFGTVTVECGDAGPVRCMIQFQMDIPQALERITVTLPGQLEGVHSRLALEEEESVPVEQWIDAGSDAGTQVHLTLPAAFSTTDLHLHLEAAPEVAEPNAGKRTWLPTWLRR